MNPYRLDTPAIVSFSGGRTSGFLLRQVIDAFRGALPDDVRAVFCNTGLEHSATYRFIEDVATQWAVPIVWLEYRATKSVAVVTPETASRAGEPFSAVIANRGYLPNPVTRFCTTELKIRSTYRYVTGVLGWEEYTNAVGLRADEPHRVARLKGDRKAESTVAPMATAGHTLEDVRRFWQAQPFDLELPNDDHAYGNCVGCFLKGAGKLVRLMREAPEHFNWWLAQEQAVPPGARCETFRHADRPDYATLMRRAQQGGTQCELFAARDADMLPCMCTD